MTGDDKPVADVSGEIAATMKRLARQGKLTCPQALAIAGDFDVSPRLVGRIADQLQITITHCQLGVFSN